MTRAFLQLRVRRDRPDRGHPTTRSRTSSGRSSRSRRKPREVHAAERDNLEVLFDKRSLHYDRVKGEVVDEARSHASSCIANWLHLNRAGRRPDVLRGRLCRRTALLATSGIFTIAGKKASPGAAPSSCPRDPGPGHPRPLQRPVAVHSAVMAMDVPRPPDGGSQQPEESLVAVRGPDLRDPLLNKGTAFTDEERCLNLHASAAARARSRGRSIAAQRRSGAEQTPEKYVFLRGLQDSNETLSTPRRAPRGDAAHRLPPDRRRGLRALQRCVVEAARAVHQLAAAEPHREDVRGSAPRPHRRSSSSAMASASSASATRAPAAWASPSASSRSPRARAFIPPRHCPSSSTSAPTTRRARRSALRRLAEQRIRGPGVRRLAGALRHRRHAALANVLLQWEDGREPMRASPREVPRSTLHVQ